MKSFSKQFMFVLVVLLCSFSFVILADKTYMKVINKDKVIYVEDIQNGDFVEAGAYLTTDKNGIHWVSRYSGYGRKYSELFQVCFSYQGDCVENELIKDISDTENLLVPEVSSVYGDLTGYNGWELKEAKEFVRSYDSSMIVNYVFIFVPAKENVTKESALDSKNYSLSTGTCSDNSSMTYDWYKETEVKLNTDFDTSTDSLTQSFNNNGLYVYVGHYYNIPFEFEFEAEAGDVLSFDISNTRFPGHYIGDDQYKDSEVTVTITNGDSVTESKYSTSINFTHVSLRIKKSGTQKMAIKIGTVGSTNIKNVKLLEHINSAQTLDKSELKNDDNIYYTCSCGNEVVSDGSITYTLLKDEDDSKDNNESDNNENKDNGTNTGNDSSNDTDKEIPNTGAFISVGLIAILLLCGIIAWSVADKKRKFNRL